MTHKFKKGDKVRLVHHDYHPTYLPAYNKIFTVERVYTECGCKMLTTLEPIDINIGVYNAFQRRFELVESKQLNEVVDDKFKDMFV